MTLKQLRYFIAVAEDLHFGRAAERLVVSQPPLSQQIRKLERALGHDLFSRKPSVRLTPAGEAFLPAARQVLTGVDRAVDLTRRAAVGEIGHVAVGFAASAAVSALPEIVRACRQELPDVAITMRELSTAEQTRALISGSIDVGFLREPNPNEALHAEASMEEPLIAVLAEEHPLASRRTFPLSELQSEPFLLFPRAVAPGLHDHVLATCAAAGFAPRVLQETRAWLTIVALVECGLGVSLVPASFRRLKWGRVAYRDLDPTPSPTRLVLCRGPAEPSAATTRFVAIARSILEAGPA
ncbi:MAG: LysR substrate-binding domain-containing protein [Gemmatimonadetes bacterium]|nr:LysR substrate-binding domain-containing protein [Gemmatimonadota bacterium]